MKPLFYTLICLFSSIVFAQVEPTNIVRANNEMAKFYINGIYNNKPWKISPELNPDIFYYGKEINKIAIKTDLDSVVFNVSKGKTIDFIVLLNQKDTARTQLQLYIPIDYLAILKKGKKYNLKDERLFPKFTYQSKEDSNLVKLRTRYNLDSIAGKGNEISQLLNLLHWMHNTVPHDGQNGLPDTRNAYSMLEVCKKENRGLNCRGLAIALNECYLSMGFKSRYVTCMPKDSTFEDCHVINMVFSNDLNKWIYLDPTHDAYVMNENGILLSIEEVRERLINGKPMILNPTANWNYKISTYKEEYLYNYMAKNLYRIECPINSQYDSETFISQNTFEMIELLPLDAYNQKNENYFNTQMNIHFISNKTNNPSIFWAKP